MTTLNAEQVQVGINADAAPIWAVYFTFTFDTPMPTVGEAEIVSINRISTDDETWTDPYWGLYDIYGGDFLENPAAENPSSSLYVLPPNLLVEGLQTWWALYTVSGGSWPYEEAWSGALTISLADAAQWTTIAAVRTMLGALEAGYTDEEITTAIVTATARLESVFCVTVAIDPMTLLPDDPNVQSATTVMASRLLVQPAVGIPPVQGGQITSERMGSYSYSVRPGTSPTSTGPQTIDGVIKDFVAGYLCPGYAGIPIQTDIYPYAAAETLADISTGVTA